MNVPLRVVAHPLGQFYLAVHCALHWRGHGLGGKGKVDIFATQRRGLYGTSESDNLNQHAKPPFKKGLRLFGVPPTQVVVFVMK